MEFVQNQSTASLRRHYFWLFDETTGLVPQTGKTPTVTTIKNDGTVAAGGGTVSEVDAINAAGLYYYEFLQAELDTLGPIGIIIEATGCVDRRYTRYVTETGPSSGIEPVGTVMGTLGDIQGTGFVKDTDSLVNIKPRFDAIDTDLAGVALEATLTGAQSSIETAIQTAEDNIRDGTETLQSLKTAIDAIETTLVDGSPVRVALDETYETPDGYLINTGTYVSGTIQDTFAQDGQLLIFAPTAGDALDVQVRASLGDKRPSILKLHARYTAAPPTGGQHANVFIYDYEQADWVQTTNTANRLNHSASTQDYSVVLFDSYVDPTGNVLIRFVGSRANVNDRLALDNAYIDAVGVGPTVGDIAVGVWDHDIYNRQLDNLHKSAAFFLSRTVGDWGQVLSIAGNDITFDRVRDVVDLYNGRTLQFHLGGANTYAFARIVAHKTGKVFEVDTVPTEVAADPTLWHAYVLPEGTDLNDVAAARSAIQGDIAALNDFDPVNDVVARVTLVDTTTANTDMRGTDGAMLAGSYVAPDNTGIGNIEGKVDTLHDVRLTAGRATNLDNLDDTVSSRSSHTVEDIWAYTTRTLTSFGTLVADIATAVWGAAARTLTAFGFSVATNKDADIDAIKAKTDGLPADPASQSAVETKIDGVPAAVDAQLSATHGAGLWDSSLGTGQHEVTITVRDDTSHVPLPTVTVYVYNSTQTGVLAWGLTNADGQIKVLLDDGTYYIRARRLGSYMFPTAVELIVDGADEAVTIEGTEFGIIPPISPDVCKVYGWTYDPKGLPISVEVKAVLVGGSVFDTNNSVSIISEAVTVSSQSSDGYWELELTRSSVFSRKGVKYAFYINEVRQGEFRVPESPTVKFSELKC